MCCHRNGRIGLQKARIARHVNYTWWWNTGCWNTKQPWLFSACNAEQVQNSNTSGCFHLQLNAQRPAHVQCKNTEWGNSWNRTRSPHNGSTLLTEIGTSFPHVMHSRKYHKVSRREAPTRFSTSKKLCQKIKWQPQRKHTGPSCQQSPFHHSHSGITVMGHLKSSLQVVSV